MSWAQQKRYAGRLWSETPLIRSNHISSLLQCDVYLKLESFKYRGISHCFAQHALRTYGRDVHLIIASSGNADRATIEYMKREGADIVTEGEYYSQAFRAAEKGGTIGAKGVSLLDHGIIRTGAHRGLDRIMVPGYDDPIVWEGHASMIHEIRTQLPEGTKPDAIFCSFGGGGLAGGVMEGCKAAGWDDVPLVAVETHGSNCFYQSLSLNARPEGTTARLCSEHDVAVAHLSALTSKATSLGASSPSPAVVKKALERKGGVKSVCVPDEMAMQAALNFAEDHKTLVELACSATIATAYKPEVFRRVVPEVLLSKRAIVVLIVCGGFKVLLDDMQEYQRVLAANMNIDGGWEVSYNGEKFNVSKT